MSNLDQGASARSDEALEQLLKHASPRPMPSESDEIAVREAVRAEWQAVSGRRRLQRRVAGFAIAASVIVVVFYAFGLIRLPAVEAEQVATIERSFGSIYLLGEASELQRTPALSRVLSGQTIVTGEEAGMALTWGAGGSLRIDANSRVRFVDGASVYLASGRVYFDSLPSALAAGNAGDTRSDFAVITDIGAVTHVGTQFMTRVADGSLIVSVREGRVEIDNRFRKHFASVGEQLTISDRGQTTVLNVSRSGEAWDWVSRTAPMTDVEGKSLHEFLLWACRETGLEYHYEGGAEQIARYEAVLRGHIDTEPLQALKLRVESAGLEWAIVDGAIYVSDKAINIREK